MRPTRKCITCRWSHDARCYVIARCSNPRASTSNVTGLGVCRELNKDGLCRWWQPKLHVQLWRAFFP